MKAALALCAALSLAPSVCAITIATVPIGDPNNPGDSRYANFGAVSQSFNMGTTEVTNLQYVAFLNAIASSDPYGLFNPSMATDSVGGIVRTGTDGNYTYSVKPPASGGSYAYDNKPVVYVSFGDAARLANWLHNGQPHGAETASTTETGAYTLNGAIGEALISAFRSRNAQWWIPSANEWYKAAYYNPSTHTYFTYATGSNTTPNNNLPESDTGDSANFRGATYTTGDSSLPLTDAGAYTLSKSPYGTFDQNGNVTEWTEEFFYSMQQIPPPGFYWVERGGMWSFDSSSLGATQSYLFGPPSRSSESSIQGIRLASAVNPIDLRGDFNGNGVVDIADYVAWRNGPSNIYTANDYDAWRANYGAKVGVAASGTASIPEPSAIPLMLGAVAALFSRGSRPAAFDRGLFANCP